MTKILVIEDEDNVRDIICEMLSSEKFDVIDADNGQVGLLLATKSSPDLIVCDVMMPILDGYGVLNELRKDKNTAIIPFIFLTAKVSKEDFRQGMRLGADDYLTKPFTRDELLSAVTARLAKQVALMQQYTVEHQRSKDLEKKLQSFQCFTETKDEIFHKFSEDLRNSVAKINMAIHMLNSTQPEVQRDRYIEILQNECNQEINLLNQVTELRKFLTPENVDILRQYNLLRG